MESLENNQDALGTKVKFSNAERIMKRLCLPLEAA